MLRKRNMELRNKILFLFFGLVILIFPVSAYTINQPIHEVSFNHWELNITFNTTTERNNIWGKINTDKVANIVNFSYINIGGLTYVVSASLINYKININALCTHCSNWYLNTTWETIEIYNVSNGCLNCIANYSGLYNKSDRWINITTYTDIPYWNLSSTIVYINLTSNESQIGKAVNSSKYYPDNANGNTTFSVFNSGNTLSGWNYIGASIVSGKIQITSGAGHLFALNQTISRSMILSWGGQSDGIANGYGLTDSNSVTMGQNIDGHNSIFISNAGDSVLKTVYKDASAAPDSGNGATDTSTHNYSISWGNTIGTTYFYKDGVLLTAPISNFPTTTQFNIMFSQMASGTGARMNISNIRAYTYPTNGIEPTVSYNTTIVPPPGYSISGFVLDNSGIVLNNTFVSYSGGSNTTNISGYYIINNMLDGVYTFTASAGYYSQSKSITISGSNLTNQNFTLPFGVDTTTLNNNISTAGAMGFMGGIVGGALVIGFIKRNKKEKIKSI